MKSQLQYMQKYFQTTLIISYVTTLRFLKVNERGGGVWEAYLRPTFGNTSRGLTNVQFENRVNTGGKPRKRKIFLSFYVECGEEGKGLVSLVFPLNFWKFAQKIYGL